MPRNRSDEERKAPPKFVQIECGNEDGDHTLYGLDEQGKVWVLDELEWVLLEEFLKDVG